MQLVFIGSHGAAKIKGVDLGNLNPIYERELNEPSASQMYTR